MVGRKPDLRFTSPRLRLVRRTSALCLHQFEKDQPPRSGEPAATTVPARIQKPRATDVPYCTLFDLSVNWPLAPEPCLLSREVEDEGTSTTGRSVLCHALAPAAERLIDGSRGFQPTDKGPPAHSASRGATLEPLATARRRSPDSLLDFLRDPRLTVLGAEREMVMERVSTGSAGNEWKSGWKPVLRGGTERGIRCGQRHTECAYYLSNTLRRGGNCPVARPSNADVDQAGAQERHDAEDGHRNVPHRYVPRRNGRAGRDHENQAANQEQE